MRKLYEHPLDQFADKFLVGDDCWPWVAYINPAGYGTINMTRDGVKRPYLAHRVIYEMMVGAIPDNRELDHLCRNRACVRPSHLDPVTHRQNMLRGQWATATHCTNGHEWNEDSIYWRTDGEYPSRQCRVCSRIRDRRRA